MKTLVLVRHAKSSRDDPALNDADRPLSRRGLRDAEKTAAEFARTGIKPDRVLSSPSRRTRETAGFFARKLELGDDAVEFEPRIYEAERADLIRLVHEQDDRLQTVMLVGHNPGLTDLFHHLLTSDIRHLPTGTAVVMDFPAKRWRDVACNSGALRQLLCPDTEKLQRMDEGDCSAPLTLRQKIFFWRMRFGRKLELFGFFLFGLLLIVGTVLLLMNRMTAEGGPPAGSSYRQVEGGSE